MKPLNNAAERAAQSIANEILERIQMVHTNAAERYAIQARVCELLEAKA